MKKILILLACACLTLPAFAGDFSLDLLVGSTAPEGSERTDTSYAVGVDYATPAGWTVAGRAIHQMIDVDAYSFTGRVGLERHFGHSAFSPYLGFGVGVVAVNLPDVERAIVVESDCDYESYCSPVEKRGRVSGDDSWLASGDPEKDP